MNISEYYNKAMEIGRAAENDFPSIMSALDYESGDDRPSAWVPKVQAALLEYFKIFPGSVAADAVLALYVQGEIMENHNERSFALKVGVVTCAMGLLIGWLLWA